MGKALQFAQRYNILCHVESGIWNADINVLSEGQTGTTVAMGRHWNIGNKIKL